MVSAVTPTIPPTSTEGKLSHLPGFDGMRAIAAVSVLLYHSLWRSPSLKPLAPVLGHADIGVEIFFVMSGFLVSRPLVRHAVSGGKPVAFGNFWRKRFARIWPAYLAALAGAMVIGVGQIDGPSGWAKHLLLIQTWFVDRGGSGLRVSWTLVVEVAFYAAVVPLGALVALARGRSHDAWIALCLASLAAGAVAMVFVSYGPTAVAFRVLPPYLLSFAAGMLLAGAEVDRSTATWSRPVITAVRKLAARPAVCFGLALGLFAALAAVVPGDPIAPAVDRGLERTVQSFVQVAVSFLAIAPLALRSTEARWLEHRALTALGAASFGFYLWHIQILRLLRPMLGGSALTAWAAVAIAIVAAYLAGEASRRWVEEPTRKLLTR